MSKVLVAGAGGFIGGHLAKRLIELGYTVRCVDIKPLKEWYQLHDQSENISADLMEKDNCFKVMDGIDIVFNLSCRMGGVGFIQVFKGECITSVLINTHLLMAARHFKVKKYFFASSGCIYNVDQQETHNEVALKETDAYPAKPEPGYGEEKLFGERMCQIYREDYGLETYIARFFNIYGPFGTWDGGKEKAPAAICRKVINAKLSNNHNIEIWGNGEQLRNFTYIDDCIDGILKLMDSDYHDPLNLGSSECVTINQLVDIASEIGKIKLDKKYLLDKPRGVNSRNTDNTLIKQVLNWEPSTPLREGLEKTYKWIESEINKGGSGL